jgi:hypothetical protein
MKRRPDLLVHFPAIRSNTSIKLSQTNLNRPKPVCSGRKAPTYSSYIDRIIQHIRQVGGIDLPQVDNVTKNTNKICISPRRPRSPWSKLNVDWAEVLMAAPAASRAVRLQKAIGKLEAENQTI